MTSSPSRDVQMQQAGPSQGLSFPEVLQCTINRDHTSEAAVPVEFRCYLYLLDEDNTQRAVDRTGSLDPAESATQRVLTRQRAKIAQELAFLADSLPQVVKKIHALLLVQSSDDSFRCEQWVALGYLFVYRFADFGSDNSSEAAENC